MRVCTLCPGPVATLFGGKAGNESSILFKAFPVASAASVANYAWDGMLRGHRTMVHGWINWLAALSSSVTPTSVVLPVSQMLLRPA